jgi:hypothetical protein
MEPILGGVDSRESGIPSMCASLLCAIRVLNRWGGEGVARGRYDEMLGTREGSEKNQTQAETAREIEQHNTSSNQTRPKTLANVAECIVHKMRVTL